MLNTRRRSVRGPVLEQDNILHETLKTFIHEKPLESPVHVTGCGAFGYFQTVNAMARPIRTVLPATSGPAGSRYRQIFACCKQSGYAGYVPQRARFLHQVLYGTGRLRSGLQPHPGIRRSRRHSVSGSHTVSAAFSRQQPNRAGAVLALRRPGAGSHQLVLRLYSDAGTIKSLPSYPGYSVTPTFGGIRRKSMRTYEIPTGFHLAGESVRSISREASRLLAKIPIMPAKDLYRYLGRRLKGVEYGLYVQLMNPQDEAHLPFDPLDDTKVWDEQQYPSASGRPSQLNRNPDNYSEQVEKLAFSPEQPVAGAELSDDKMLQGRANIYWDSQRRRLGPDFRSIPINHQQHWSPDSLVTSGNGRFVEGRLERTDIPKQDDFMQAGEFYRSLAPLQQEHLVAEPNRRSCPSLARNAKHRARLPVQDVCRAWRTGLSGHPWNDQGLKTKKSCI